MKKWIAGLTISVGILGFSTNVLAAEINGESTGSIPVQGTLGADNTDENGGIDEGNEDWVNVTVPSKTLFYSSPGEDVIKAPTYSIINNSGRPVTIQANGFTLNGPNGINQDTNLEVNLDATAGSSFNSIPIIKEGAAIGPLSNVKIAELGNNAGKLTSDAADGSAPSEMTFTYSGSLDGSKVTTKQVSNYNLKLRFVVPDTF
ncbi:hypothetical protein [Enterococcus sp. CSURQ0835]|uniref:hypothetical protein n=1 Tax=Enterococcus sp. CSURQ0835 TaxID=2681394 RepID=UPI001358318E|nr:hypothetical protein [Enterococcus sp. CSURQ0835]